VPTNLGDSKFVDLLRKVRPCYRKINDAFVSKLTIKFKQNTCSWRRTL